MTTLADVIDILKTIRFEAEEDCENAKNKMPYKGTEILHAFEVFDYAFSLGRLTALNTALCLLKSVEENYEKRRISEAHQEA